jgi:hypothetical protein
MSTGVSMEEGHRYPRLGKEATFAQSVVQDVWTIRGVGRRSSP